MKKLLSFGYIFLFITSTLIAQAPEKMSYQAVIRNSNNELVSSINVALQLSIIQGSIDGDAVYVETQTLSTNSSGLVSLQIGNGTNVLGTFSDINWANGPYFIKTEIDPDGPIDGISYAITGTSQLLSVPYAIQSKYSSGFVSLSQNQRDLLSPKIGSTVFNTTTNKPNYYDGVDWRNYDGTPARPVVVGENFGGGKVAYIFQAGDVGYDASVQHGIIVSLNDKANVSWGPFEESTPNAAATAIGKGSSNTKAILDAYSIYNDITTSNCAAKYCNELAEGGFSDWFLPSRDELIKICENKTILGLTALAYWSSTETDYSNAYLFDVTNNFAWGINKATADPSISIRAIRMF